MNGQTRSPEDDSWNTVPSFMAWMAWRKERVSVEQVESEAVFGGRQLLSCDFKPWVDLKQQLRPGDELWTFDSPKRFWRKGMGCRGLVLVRSGTFVAACVIAMN
jgi:hypothetical protein